MELEHLCRDLGIRDRVVFTGSVSEALKSSLFQETSGFALLSLTEVLAMSVLEAMQYSKPVIVTDTNAFDAFIKKGVIYGADRDANTIAKILLKMLTADTDTTSLGRRAKEEIQNNYTWDSIAKETLAKIYSDGIRQQNLSISFASHFYLGSAVLCCFETIIS